MILWPIKEAKLLVTMMTDVFTPGLFGRTLFNLYHYMIYNARLHLKKKVSNLLEYFHPQYLRAVLTGAAAEQRHSIRKSLRYRRPEPPTEQTKRAIIRDYAERSGCRIFVETGTYRGDTLVAVSDLFEELHSVEIDETLYRQATERFRGEPKIHLHQGDSGLVLLRIAANYREPILFWLDGHASGGDTGSGEKHTPILEELKVIMSHPVRSHVVLIDDAMDFGTEPDYPSLRKLRRITRSYPDFVVAEHIVRITSGLG